MHLHFISRCWSLETVWDRERPEPGSQTIFCWAAAPPLTRLVTLGESFDFSKPEDGGGPRDGERPQRPWNP